MIIYKITNNINNKIYIGQTIKSLTIRKRGYKSSVKFKNSKTTQSIILAMRKYGFDNFNFEVLYNCETREELDYLEKYLISYYNTTNNGIGYNIEHGGTNGKNISKSTIEKLSVKAKEKYKSGYINPFKGKKHTEENKLQFSINRKNNPNYIGKGRLGKKFNSPKWAKPILQYTLDGIFIKEYKNSTEAEKLNPGFKSRSIRMVCHNKRNLKKHKGYIWKFKHDTE